MRINDVKIVLLIKIMRRKVLVQNCHVKSDLPPHFVVQFLLMLTLENLLNTNLRSSPFENHKNMKNFCFDRKK